MDSIKIKEYKRGQSPFNLVTGHVQAVGAGLKYFVKPQKITLKYPEESMTLPSGYRGMIRLYKDVCIGCTLCAMVCPADAMKMVTEQGKKLPSINYGRCVFCAFCVDICPVDALKETGVHDATFSNRRELIFTPDKFDQDFDQPPVNPVVRKVKPVIDEKKGIKYVPDSE
ncbi:MULTISPECIES: NADH-quinone oxidoreductase subunit NuoI [Metallosphaera]|uniref:NADH dehydrogenase subunit I n=1 Tax=Metallosphaera cuprina (strain Ar-4) TaxID=1006006 RepID=F4FZR4_METCR|nr:NADH-quinone oxidoreductase subunit NuoI [Metallosphaera cuprina]AEB94493.1 NADH dehydrogenase subunit I [Metallosphaera cuprina Ar-4]